MAPGASTADRNRRGDLMPGKKYRSIQNPKQYEALKRKGFSKTSAAKISNAKTKGHKVKKRKAK